MDASRVAATPWAATTASAAADSESTRTRCAAYPLSVRTADSVRRASRETETPRDAKVKISAHDAYFSQEPLTCVSYLLLFA